MKTTKPFSTISYNSKDFLQGKLDELIQKRAIAFYAFVKHYREEDEKKDHIHLLIMPNGQIQTDSVIDILQELDPASPLKPLGVMPFHSSKWADWFLYSCHDSGYLASKGQSRKHHYEEKDFVCSDEDYLHEMVTTIDRSKYAKTQDFVQKVSNGASFLEMLKAGQIPAPQFNQWLSMYEFIQTGATYRNGRYSHTPADSEAEHKVKVNEDTGEVEED